MMNSPISGIVLHRSMHFPWIILICWLYSRSTSTTPASPISEIVRHLSMHFPWIILICWLCSSSNSTTPASSVTRIIRSTSILFSTWVHCCAIFPWAAFLNILLSNLSIIQHLFMLSLNCRFRFQLPLCPSWSWMERGNEPGRDRGMSPSSFLLRSWNWDTL